MTTKSAKLGLVIPGTNDPFSTKDIAGNWATLDGSPGTFPCTSSTRPTWTTAQIGRRIVETDTHRELQWTGTAWQEPAVAVGEWAFVTSPNATLGPNANVTYTMGTINVQRPCVVLMIHRVRAEFRPFLSQWLSSKPVIDGAAHTLGSAGALVQWADLSSASSTAYDARSDVVFGHATLAPGAHTIGAQVTVGSAAGASIWLTDLQTAVIVISGFGGTATL